MYPEDLKYTEQHEWTRADSGRVRVGITSFATESLGDVVYVQLPAEGDRVAAGDTFGEVESTKSVSDLYAPVAGVVVAANAALENQPELVNSDPYGEGWLVEIEVEDPAQLDALLSSEEYGRLTT